MEEYSIDELLLLTKELSDIYTSMESTSISYEVAQQLMGAVLYCIEEHDFANERNTEEGILVTGKSHAKTAREAYDNGYRLVTNKIKQANSIYADIMKDFRSYGSHAYYATMVEGIPEFFKWYDPRLNPANHIILLDYTVMEQLSDLEGVDLIYRYLLCVRLEQKFLKQFPDQYIREVLIQNHPDYEELFENICRLVLKKVLVSMLIGTKLDKIEYESNDYEKIGEEVRSTSKVELENKLHYLLKILITNIYEGDLDLYRYLDLEVSDLQTELRNGTINNSLRNIF